MRSDEERIAAARAAGWTHFFFATGPSTHPMCSGIRSIESGPRVGDEILLGTPPGKWYPSDDSKLGSGPGEELPE